VLDRGLDVFGHAHCADHLHPGPAIVVLDDGFLAALGEDAASAFFVEDAGKAVPASKSAW